jgi:DNA-binding NtrC family response regulator
MTRTRRTGGAGAAEDMRVARLALGCRSDKNGLPQPCLRRFLGDLKVGGDAADVGGMTPRDGAASAWLPAASEPARATTPSNDAAEASTPAPVVTLPVDLPHLLRELEDAYIKAALARTQSNKKEAAKLLGLGRTTLVEKLRRRGMARSAT